MVATRRQVDSAWEKGKPVQGRNPGVWRRDPFGNLLRKASYGTQGEYGWHVDHKNPKSRGGTENPRNIQPLHWQENLKKSDKYPYKAR